MNVRRFLEMLFILVIAATLTQAQSKRDSLLSIWNNTSLHDTTRFEAYDKFVYSYFMGSQDDSVLYYGTIYYDSAVARNSIRYQGTSLSLMAQANVHLGNYSVAEEQVKRAVEIYESIGRLEKEQFTFYMSGMIQYMIGNIEKGHVIMDKTIETYLAQNRNSKAANSALMKARAYTLTGNKMLALKEVEFALELLKETDELFPLANAYLTQGDLYLDLDMPQKAFQYFEKSQELFDQIDAPSARESAAMRKGFALVELKDYDNALPLLKSALSSKIGQVPEIQGEVQQYLGKLMMGKGNTADAERYLLKGIDLISGMNDPLLHAKLYNQLGKLYLSQDLLGKAKNWCKKANDKAVGIQSISLERDACDCLYRVYKKRGKKDIAFDYSERLGVLNDSIQREQAARSIQLLEFKQQKETDSLKQAEKKRLLEIKHQEEIRKKNQTRNWTIAGGFLALLLAAGFYSRWRYVRESKAIIESERDRSDNLLLNILPADIAQELKEKGKADARDFEQVCILFTDFKSFTQQSEKLSAAELVNEINHCFEAFDGIVEKYDIEKIKTIGDAYMAAGGLPVPSDDSVKNTVMAALEMQAFITSRKAKMDEEGQPAFEMRVGIHTGPVVAGIVGVKKFQYDIWGDTVNTASRMESAGEVGKVNISNDTYKLIKDDDLFIFESRGKIDVKGKGQMDLWFVKLKESQDDHPKA